MERYINDKNEFAPSNIMIDGALVMNPTEEQLIVAGYHKYVAPEKTLDDYKNDKIHKIMSYDSSSSVNSITVKHGDDEFSYWLNMAQRSKLRVSAQTMKDLGYKTYRLDIREKGISIDADIDTLITSINKMEEYATLCYRATTDNLNAVKALTTIDEVNNYDYKTGYPTKLIIEL